MSDPTNLYQDLKNALDTFHNYINTNIVAIKAIVTSLRGLGLSVDPALDLLLKLMNDLTTAVNNIDLNKIPVVADLTSFTTNVQTLLQATKTLLPPPSTEVDDALAAVKALNAVGSLTTQLKGEVLTALGTVIGDLQTIKKP